MSERWKLGNYEFLINPNRYGEQLQIIGDNVRTLDGSLITQPTTTQESYHLSSVFFQHRPRVLTEVSIGKGHGLEFTNNRFYVLDKEAYKVNVYSSNLSTLEKSITIIDTPSGQNLVALDVQSDETVWAVERLAPDSNIHKVVGTSKTITAVTGLSGEITGIKHLNNYLWVVTNHSRLYKLNPSDMSIVTYANLPNIPTSSYGYQGMTAIDNYLVVSYSDGEMSGAVFIDSDNGNLCNSFQFPDYKELQDISYNGKEYIFLLKDQVTIRYTNGNTVLLDLYKLEKQIKSYGFLSMIDDMGVDNRVAVADYSISRRAENLQKYDVSISATKVDRGVN